MTVAFQNFIAPNDWHNDDIAWLQNIPYIIIAQESKLKITILDNIVEVTEKFF
jgi:hypothetical protein